MNLKLVEHKGEEAAGAMAESLVAALKQAKDQGKPFVIEWRQSDAQARRWQDEGGAGCSCGGGSFD
jgi:hypothetical protein